MGFLGKQLNIDLTSRRITLTGLSGKVVRNLLGGRGLNAWLLYRNVNQETHPFEPQNILALSCGLLTGTIAPASSRLHVSSKSPLTGFLGSSDVGGRFGAAVRSCGFQSIVIRGRARHPVSVWIRNGSAEIADASSLWGLDVWETNKRLKGDPEDKRLEIMTIGPAGENRVLFSSIMVGCHNAAARTGMGAVMGSKNLKAIVVQRERSLAPTDPLVTTAAKRYTRQIKDSALFPRYSTYGVPQSLLPCNEMGVLGTRNFRNVQFEDATEISGERLHEYVTRARTCYRCPAHCKADVRISHGKYAGHEGSRPEFESLMAMGSRCGLNDTGALIYLCDLCNRMGLDTVSTGAIIAFSMDLYDRGILTLEDTGGTDLTWGNYEAMETLIYQIVRRERLGGILSHGVERAARIIGKGSEEYAYHVKRLEMPSIDPRGLMALGLGYAVTTRGADFASVYTLPESRWSPEKAEIEFGTREAVNRFSTEGKAALTRKCMIVCAALDCLGLCKIPALSVIGDFDLKKEASLTEAVSGWRLDSEDLVRVGERVLSLERLFNLRQGATAADDGLPRIFLEKAASEGPGEGKKVEGLASMIEAFYSAMTWDDKGVPSEHELESLGLVESPKLK